MGKTRLGIDIGYNSMKLALVNKGNLKKYVIAPMPENMVQGGRVVSPEATGEMIRDLMKENGIRAHEADIVLPNETVFLRNVIMPQMPIEQLKTNLPYEFRDYINLEVQKYYYDYAVIQTEVAPSEGETEEGQAPQGKSMELLAVAVQKEQVETIRGFLRKAGLKLRRAAPTVSCWQGLIRTCGSQDAEYCILDLGYNAIRMDMFNGDRHMVTREMDVGINRLIHVVADIAAVDEHLAKLYIEEDHDGWQDRDECKMAYENIAVDIMRALNFYKFSTPETKLNDIYLCGGGALIKPLCEIIGNTVGMNIHKIDELVPNGDKTDNCALLAQAIGITLE